MNDFKQIAGEFLTEIIDGVLLVATALIIALLILIPLLVEEAEITQLFN